MKNFQRNIKKGGIIYIKGFEGNSLKKALELRKISNYKEKLITEKEKINA